LKRGFPDVLRRGSVWPGGARAAAARSIGGARAGRGDTAVWLAVCGVSSRGAVRCGALLIDRYAPTLGESYRGLYLESTSAAEGAAFNQAFDVPDVLLVEMRRELRLE
jgi:hypothetical protein